MEALCRLSYSGDRRDDNNGFSSACHDVDMRRFVAGAVLMSLVACVGGDRHPDRPPSFVTFGGSEAVLVVSVADSQAEQRQGLMGVEHLPDNEGMAFVYEEPVEHSFWMKDTLIPLSIAFVDGSGRVVGLREMQPCRADPCPTYGVGRPYVLAVEANRGWFENHGVGVGDRAELRVMAYQ
jgi:uncharacterized membrane protein (UPF0127 family)